MPEVLAVEIRVGDVMENGAVVAKVERDGSGSVRLTTKGRHLPLAFIRLPVEAVVTVIERGPE